MCLIIHKPAGKKIPQDVMLGALYINRDGYGIMYSQNGSLVVEKSLSEMWLRRRLHELQHLELVIHFRMATHGAVDENNCHPFHVTQDIAMVHNGILHDYDADKYVDQSDTSMFVSDILTPMMLTSPELYGSEVATKMLEKVIGSDNRLVFMRADGKVWSINRHTGLEYNGVWLSNTYSWKGAFKPVNTKPVATSEPVTAKKVWEKAKAKDDKYYSERYYTSDDWENTDNYLEPRNQDNMNAEDLFYLEFDTLLDLLIKAPEAVARMIYGTEVSYSEDGDLMLV